MKDNIYNFYGLKVGIAAAFLILGSTAEVAAQTTPTSISTKISNTEIEGIVRDSEGNPIPNAKVVNNHQKVTVHTDKDGNFRIYAKAGDEIQISNVGFYIYKQIIADNSPIYATLKSAQENEKIIDELVITGYQKIQANRAAAPVEKINIKNFERRGATDIVKGLEGLSASLVMSSNPNDPTGSKELTIRGVATLAGSSAPLIIVDGFQYEGDLRSVNPYEIESINLLKDAASASIYGAKSANGVIVITTKKGKSGGTQVRYTSNLTFQNKANLGYLLNRASTNDLINIQSQIAQNAINTANATGDVSRVVNYRNRLETEDFPEYVADNNNRVYHLYSQLYHGYITQNEFDTQLALLRTLDNTNDLRNTYLQNPFTNQQNISVMGGNAGFRYRTSLNYTDEQGNIKNSKNNRILFDFVSDIKFSPRISFDFQANYTLNNNQYTPLDWDGDVSRFTQISKISSYDTFYNADGSTRSAFMPYFNGVYRGLLGGKDPYEIERLIGLGLLDETYYPALDFGKYSYSNRNWALRLQGLINYKITNDLNFKFGGQIQRSAGTIRNIASADSWYMRQLINNTTPLSYTGDRRELNIPIGARLQERREEANNYLLRAQVDYNKTFGEHYISALLGTEIQNVERASTSVDRFGYDEVSNLFLPINNHNLSQSIEDVYMPEGGRLPSGIALNDDFSKAVNRFFSVYANAHYSFKNRYIITGSIRMDQSNLFGTDPQYRYKPFWSVGAKWRLGEENFLKDKNVLLDIRGSYGVNGNIANSVGPFDIASKDYVRRAENHPGLNIVSYKIPNLRWESTHTTNAGFDTKFFKNRLALSFDYYHKNTQDVLSAVEIDPTLGNTSVVRNDANIINRGYELQLTSKNIETENFSWETQANFRLNKGKVEKVFTNTDGNSPLNYAGTPINLMGYEPNSLFVFDFAGLNNEGYAQIRKDDGTLVVINEDIRPENVFAMNDLKYAGTTLPKYVVGLNNNITYKNFSLSFSLIYQGGHKLLKDSYNGELFGRRLVALNSDAAQAWQKTGDEAITNIPAIGSTSYPAVVANSSKNVISGDFIRLRDVVLSYTLPKQFTESLKISELTFNVRGGNLWLWTQNKEGIDPETQGLGFRTLPLQKSFTFGVNVLF